jgi:hypothetical protein
MVPDHQEGYRGNASCTVHRSSLTFIQVLIFKCLDLIAGNGSGDIHLVAGTGILLYPETIIVQWLHHL